LLSLSQQPIALQERFQSLLEFAFKEVGEFAQQSLVIPDLLFEFMHPDFECFHVTTGWSGGFPDRWR
jgi:hypothetical protein